MSNEYEDDFDRIEHRAAEARKRKIAGIRELLNVFENTPNLPLPYWISSTSIWVGEDELIPLRRAVGLPASKVFTDYDVGFEFAITEDVTLRIVTSRSAVCERVQTGTRTVPAQPAVEEHEEPVYEWICPDSVLAELANE